MTQAWLAGHHARKRFGQNFLHDRVWIDRIIESIDPKPGQTIVEIGPGQGALTRHLVSAVGHVYAVEIDRDLAGFLRTQFKPDEFTLTEADALTVDWVSWMAPTRLRLIGNLPYNISSPLLFQLLEAAPRIMDQHFMLQREVVDRMVAQPGSKTYGRLSVMLQARYHLTKLFDVPPGAFTPSPKVVSSVVRMVPKTKEELLPVNPTRFAEIVGRAFRHRRKILRNSLKDWIDLEHFEMAGVDPQRRAETLSLEEFAKLTEVSLLYYWKLKR